MKAIQYYDTDLGTWRNMYDRPFGDEEAKEELKRQRRWAREDGKETKYRAIPVVLGTPEGPY